MWHDERLTDLDGPKKDKYSLHYVNEYVRMKFQRRILSTNHTSNMGTAYTTSYVTEGVRI